MIDYRLLTFMDLHETMNYTKTAQNMNITQPAVTQHIKYLEQRYNVKLFHYERKHLELTPEGEYLYAHSVALLSNATKILEEIRHVGEESVCIKMGATLTIGEYLLPTFMLHLNKTYPQIDFRVKLDNTEGLLEEVRKGNLDFAMIEGIFNKEEFHTKLLKKDEMILILPNNHELLEKKVIKIEDLLNYRILVREVGSGTRDVFVRALQQLNLSLHNFIDCMEINNINTIKKLVEGGYGISFMYKSAVLEELKDSRISTCKVRNFRLMREYNTISLKDSIYNNRVDEYHALFSEVIDWTE